jgi:hypothetical protein
MKQPFRIGIVEQRLRENPGLKEVWDQNLWLEDFWRLGQLQRFEIINSEIPRVESISWNSLISLSYYVVSCRVLSSLLRIVTFDKMENCPSSFAIRHFQQLSNVEKWKGEKDKILSKSIFITARF